jgi:hypothetical protein
LCHCPLEGVSGQVLREFANLSGATDVAPVPRANFIEPHALSQSGVVASASIPSPKAALGAMPHRVRSTSRIGGPGGAARKRASAIPPEAAILRYVAPTPAEVGMLRACTQASRDATQPVFLIFLRRTNLGLQPTFAGATPKRLTATAADGPLAQAEMRAAAANWQPSCVKPSLPKLGATTEHFQFIAAADTIAEVDAALKRAVGECRVRECERRQRQLFDGLNTAGAGYVSGEDATDDEEDLDACGGGRGGGDSDDDLLAGSGGSDDMLMQTYRTTEDVVAAVFAANNKKR